MTRTGSCLCGAVTFTVSGDPIHPAACHCTQCRKQSGHYWASAIVPDDQIAITGDLRWFAASDIACRGFCPTCGSFLFWKEHGDTSTSFALGALDNPTGLHLQSHIHTGTKGDYYDIADGLPQSKD